MNREDFSKSHNSKLSAENERRYQNWVAASSKQAGYDMHEEEMNYDLRGYWLNGGYNNSLQGHKPDTYKKPNHPTFSDESIYHNTPSPNGGTYKGGKWVTDASGNWQFAPTPQMLLGLQPTRMLSGLNNYGEKDGMGYFGSPAEPEATVQYPSLSSLLGIGGGVSDGANKLGSAIFMNFLSGINKK